MKVSDSVFQCWSYVMANCKACNEISDSEVFISFEIFESFSSSSALLHFGLDILHGAFRFFIAFDQNRLQKSFILHLIRPDIIDS